MGTNAISPTSHVAWESSKIDPIPPIKPLRPIDSFGCFGGSAKSPPKTYSLVELYHERNALNHKTTSELAAMWKSFLAIGGSTNSIYARFTAWKDDTSTAYIYRDTELKLLDQITERFLSGHGIQDESMHLSAILDRPIVEHIIDTIRGRVHKAQCYSNAVLCKIRTYKNFDHEFMFRLCTGDYCVYNIARFFEEARAFKIPHKHLFIDLDLSRFSEPVVEQLSIEAQKSEAQLIDIEEGNQIRAWVAEYNEILKSCEVPEINRLSRGMPLKTAEHGYRLAALKLHPDRNPEGTKAFQRLSELAEKLGLKDA